MWITFYHKMEQKRENRTNTNSIKKMSDENQQSLQKVE